MPKRKQRHGVVILAAERLGFRDTAHQIIEPKQPRHVNARQIGHAGLRKQSLRPFAANANRRTVEHLRLIDQDLDALGQMPVVNNRGLLVDRNKRKPDPIERLRPGLLVLVVNGRRHRAIDTTYEFQDAAKYRKVVNAPATSVDDLAIRLAVIMPVRLFPASLEERVDFEHKVVVNRINRHIIRFSQRLQILTPAKAAEGQDDHRPLSSLAKQQFGPLPEHHGENRREQARSEHCFCYIFDDRQHDALPAINT